MAPQVSVADDVERLSIVVAALARTGLAGKLSLSQVGKAAAAAGLSADQARAFMRGEVVLPSRQSVALVGAILEQDRVRQVSYMETLKQGHAGSDSQRGSYQEKVAERVKLPRGRIEDRVWCRGGPLETTAADVEASLGRLRTDFPGWAFDVDGAESLAAGKPKLAWHGRGPDRREVSGVTSLEVAEKVQAIEAGLAEDARKLAAYAKG